MVSLVFVANQALVGLWKLYCAMLIIAFFIMVLAACGKSTGTRQLYVNLLLTIFKYTNWLIGQEQQREMNELSETDEDDDDADGGAKRERNGTNHHAENLIEREATKRMIFNIYSEEPSGNIVETFYDDSLGFIKAGMESVIEDEVTSRFRSAELTTWNLMTRSSYGYHLIKCVIWPFALQSCIASPFDSWKLCLLWAVGFTIRYCILFPINVCVLVMSLIILIISGALIALLPDFEKKRQLCRKLSLICYRVLLQACSGHVTFHNRENMAKPGGICVANHTSPIDALILASNNCYALVGQKQGSFLGFIQNCLSKLDAHIWFEREEVTDKLAVRQRLLEHVEDSSKLPILIFPEGTCINNTSVMMFKKGSFEVCSVIYPVAIKYDARFGDAFWNSSKTSYFEHLIMMMTSWALVCDVWYLPPMTRLPNENSIEFANRVKKAIAKAGGLVDLDWDGQLKRYPVKDDIIENHRKRYSQRILKMEKTANGVVKSAPEL